MKQLLFFFFFTFFVWHLSGQELDHRWGEIIISFEASSRLPQQLPHSPNLQRSKSPGLFLKRQLSRPLNIWLLQFDPNQTNEFELLDQLRQKPGVRFAQFNHILHSRQTTPNDPSFSEQWQWFNNGSNGLADADVDAELAWDISQGGQTVTGTEIVVAVLDNGTQIDHPDLAANHWVNKDEIPDNGFDDDGNGYIDDYNGWNPLDQNDDVNGGSHGTGVNGMVGAVGNNMMGVCGINWNVKIMSVRNDFITDEATVLEAYAYPLEQRRIYNRSNGQNGAFVVATNASWGFERGDPADSPLWCAYYDTLGTEGILNCGATTNSNGLNVDLEGDLPTTCPSDFLISVTSTNRSDEQAGGFGPIHIDLVAPGVDVYTTDRNSGYRFQRGTSFATPIVSGMIGLLYAAPCGRLPALAQSDPAAAALLARQYILQGVDPLTGFQDLVATGGRANIFNSLNLLIDDCGSCISPFALSANSIATATAAITWSVSDETRTVDLRWRDANSTNWTEVSNANVPFELNNLRGCTTYEVQVRSICESSNSDYSPSLFFQTEGCCERPVGLAASGLEENAVVLNWNEIPGTNDFNLRYRPVGSSTWLSESSTTNSQELSDLMTCTEYELQIQSDCDTTLSSFSSILNFRTKGCGSCRDFDYCETGSENADGEWIESFQLNGIENLSGKNQGYGDFTDQQSILLQAGSTYPLVVEPGYGDFPFTEYVRIWIDFNLDGDFDDVGELAKEAPPTAGTIATNITIPNWVSEGNTRMRVSLRFGQYPEVCELLRFGEVEDYCVELVGGDGCPPPLVDIESLPDGSVQLTSMQSAGSTTNMQYRYRPVGTINWSSSLPLAEGSSTISATLEGCTVYEIQFRTVCGNTTVGVWGSDAVFKTIGCGACTDQSYCESGGVSSAFSFIQRVQLNFLDFGSGEDQGYGDFTGEAASTILGQGRNYDLTIAPFYPLNREIVRIGAWIDFNQDGDFEDSGEELMLSDTTTIALTTAVAIPADALTGVTRLRIVMIEDEDPPSACGGYSFGETEDYCIRIVAEDLPCDMPAPDTLQVSGRTIELDWEAVADATEYFVRYRPEGSTTWAERTTAESGIVLDQLSSCTPYEIQMLSLCGAAVSNFTPPLFVRTLCTTSIPSPETVDFRARLWPNPTTDGLHVAFELPFAQRVQINIHTIDGKLVQQIPPRQGVSGLQSWAFDLNLAAGLYFVRLQSESGHQLVKFVVQ